MFWRVWKGVGVKVGGFIYNGVVYDVSFGLVMVRNIIIMAK